MPRIPSAKTLSRISPEHSQTLRELLERNADYLPWTGGRINCVLAHADKIIGGHGTEYIPPGTNASSPAVTYVNLGDPYDQTLLVIDGRPVVGAWGDIVERGNYP